MMTTEIDTNMQVTCDRDRGPHRRNKYCWNPREYFPLHEAFEARITGSTQPAPETGGEWRVQRTLNHGSRVVDLENRPIASYVHRDEDARQIVTEHNAVPLLVAALKELVELIEAVREGEYKPDSFTTQPARAALAAVSREEERHGEADKCTNPDECMHEAH